MSKPVEHHSSVPMLPAKDSRRQYGVIHSSAFVYNTTRSHSPTRIDIWDNTSRPNPFKGRQLGDEVRGQVITEWWLSAHPCGLEARFCDPSNKPTDAEISILLTPECTVITDNGTNTGTFASGQVYAPDNPRLGEGDTAALVFPDGYTQDVVIHFTNNGHGYALLKFTPAKVR